MSNATNERIDQLEKRTGARFDVLEKRIDELEKQSDLKFGQMEKRFNDTDERLDVIAEHIVQIDARLDRVDQRFDDLQQTMIDGFDRNLAILRRLDQDRISTNDQLKRLEAKVGF